MLTPERAALYKAQAIAAVAQRAKNPRAPGISCVVVSPHDVLDLLDVYENAKAAALAAHVAEAEHSDTALLSEVLARIPTSELNDWLGQEMNLLIVPTLAQFRAAIVASIEATSDVQ